MGELRIDLEGVEWKSGGEQDQDTLYVCINVYMYVRMSVCMKFPND